MLPTLKVESVDKLILAIQSRITHYDTLRAIYANRQVAKRKFFCEDQYGKRHGHDAQRLVGQRQEGDWLGRLFQDDWVQWFDTRRACQAHSKTGGTARASRVCALLGRTPRECFAEMSSARFTVFPSAKDAERRETATWRVRAIFSFV